eukprot:scaffold2363_cov159-Amphora_coffeaeformis.AAC.58
MPPMPPYSNTSFSSDEDYCSTKTDAVVVAVDPYSSGCAIAKEIMSRGYSVVALWTRGLPKDLKEHVPDSCQGIKYKVEIDDVETLEETSDLLCKAAGSKDDIVCVFAAGEFGVDLAEKLAEHLHLPGNRPLVCSRRDKQYQQDLIASKGLRSVRQAGGSDFADVEPFLETESFPLVVKPLESAGSVGVKMCYSFEEAREHFHTLMKSEMISGARCPRVICQELLKGKEFVVDHVSRDGVHKTTMVWVYDKQPANGSAFVYYGMLPVDSESPEAKILIPYVRSVLDAMGVRHGATHGEVIITETGPCLVEINCRSHGGDASWHPLVRALNDGPTQIEATADAHMDGEAFAKLPDKPPSPFHASGREVTLVSYSKGTVQMTPGYDRIRQLPSYLSMEAPIRPGDKVFPTVDLMTAVGSVILLHHDPKILARDLETIRRMEKEDRMFVFHDTLSYSDGKGWFANPQQYFNIAFNMPSISETHRVV